VHCLQVLDSEALEVALSCLNARVSEDFGQVKQISTVTQIPNAEGMPERMERAANPANSQPAAQLLKIAK